MTLVRASVESTAAGVTVANQPEHLTAFLEKGCAAAIWRRKPTAVFQRWIDDLDPSQLPQGRMVLPTAAVKTTVTELCEMSQAPPGPQRAQLIDDVAALADIFASLMETQYLRLRLEAVTSNACRRFHVDAIKGRLVCTYRGAGTQYGTSRNEDDPETIFSVPTGSPILLRGTLWPEYPASGLLHRSPPIEGTGETGLLLVLDPIADREMED